MRNFLHLLAAICILSLSAALARADDPILALNVWPDKPPGDATPLGPDVGTGNTLTNVSTPTIAIYRPDPAKDTGAAVIVCPGGGFYKLTMDSEGTNVTHWLNSIGVTGILLRYRIPNRPNEPKYLAAVQDAQRAMCIVRANAAQWKLDPHRIGMVGFSAGGQTVVDVATHFDKLLYDPIDDTDKQNTRPDFVLAIYPGGIVAPGPGDALTPDVQITKQTPPMFIVIANDDRNGPENGVYLYLALKRAGVPTELHVYGEGGHGFGIRPGTAPHASWPDRAADWMRYRKLLSAPRATTQPS